MTLTACKLNWKRRQSDVQNGHRFYWSLLSQRSLVQTVLIAVLMMSTDSKCAMGCPTLESLTRFCACDPNAFNGIILNCTSDAAGSLFPLLSANREQLGLIQQLTIHNTTLNRLPNYVFKGLYIKNLDLSYNQISKVDENAFDGLENILQSLILAGNSLERIPSNAVDGLSALIQLDLSDNMIDDIDDSRQALRNLPKLVDLNLGKNKICKIHRSIMESVKHSVQTLNLGHNCLERVPAAVIRGFKRLLALHIHANHIGDLEPLQFMNLPSLNLVNLAGNRISKIHRQSFLNVPNLRLMYLSDNRISELKPQQFKHFEALEMLDLTGNQIGYLPDNAFSNMTRLSQLYLGSNGIVDMGKDVFSNSSLSILLLPNNRLTILRPESFSWLQYLQQLSFKNNTIEEIVQNTFYHSPSLVMVDLSHNRLQSLRQNTFYSQLNLFLVNLSFNRLLSTPYKAFNKRVITVLLKENPLVCKERVHLLQNGQGVFVPGTTDVICGGVPHPNELAEQLGVQIGNGLNLPDNIDLSKFNLSPQNPTQSVHQLLANNNNNNNNNNQNNISSQQQQQQPSGNIPQQPSSGNGGRSIIRPLPDDNDNHRGSIPNGNNGQLPSNSNGQFPSNNNNNGQFPSNNNNNGQFPSNNNNNGQFPSNNNNNGQFPSNNNNNGQFPSNLSNKNNGGGPAVVNRGNSREFRPPSGPIPNPSRNNNPNVGGGGAGPVSIGGQQVDPRALSALLSSQTGQQMDEETVRALLNGQTVNGIDPNSFPFGGGTGSNNNPNQLIPPNLITAATRSNIGEQTPKFVGTDAHFNGFKNTGGLPPSNPSSLIPVNSQTPVANMAAGGKGNTVLPPPPNTWGKEVFTLNQPGRTRNTGGPSKTVTNPPFQVPNLINNVQNPAFPVAPEPITTPQPTLPPGIITAGRGGANQTPGLPKWTNPRPQTVVPWNPSSPIRSSSENGGFPPGWKTTGLPPNIRTVPPTKKPNVFKTGGQEPAIGGDFEKDLSNGRGTGSATTTIAVCLTVVVLVMVAVFITLCVVRHRSSQKQSESSQSRTSAYVAAQAARVSYAGSNYGTGSLARSVHSGVGVRQNMAGGSGGTQRTLNGVAVQQSWMYPAGNHHHHNLYAQPHTPYQYH